MGEVAPGEIDDVERRPRFFDLKFAGELAAEGVEDEAAS